MTTILNPAPATPLPDELLALADYCVPNETEAELLTGLPAISLDDARTAAQALLARGPRTVIITLGERGALLAAHGGVWSLARGPWSRLASALASERIARSAI